MWDVAGNFLREVRGRVRSGHDIFMFSFDFRVKPGTGDEFAGEFDSWDHSDVNWFHKDPAQVQEGVLYRDDRDPDHFRLVGMWDDRQAHRAAFERFSKEPPPVIDKYVEGGVDAMTPEYFWVAV
jgi:hypothetical protein